MQYQHPHTIHDTAQDVQIVHTRKTYCDGAGGAAGHPRSFLKIETGETSVICPYCSRLFIYEERVS